MRSPDNLILESEGTDNFSRTWQQRYNSMHLFSVPLWSGLLINPRKRSRCNHLTGGRTRSMAESRRRVINTNTTLNEQRIRRVFVIGVLLKALNGAVELVLGVALVFVGSTFRLVQTLVRGELIEDPTDLVAGYVQHFAYPFLQHRHAFASAYLLSHGLIKLLLAAGLLREKLWAYPVAIAVFVLFAIYQLYQFYFSHSSLLMLLTIFDLVVIGLTWHEYRG